MEIKEKIEENFDSFDPKEYLREYYSMIDFENDRLLEFFYSCYQDMKPQATLLEFGIGPTLYSLITAATKVNTIHVCDRLTANLHETQLWQKATLLRRKLTHFYFCDAFSQPPLPRNPGAKYDIVQVNFVPESITSSLDKWETALCNIISLLKPSSTFILTTLKNAAYYHLHLKRFPAISIDETLLISTLIKYGFKKSDITMESISANLPYRGYDGMIFVKAQFH